MNHWNETRLNEWFPGVIFKCDHLTNIWGHPQIGKGTQIGAFVEIGDQVVIGENCKIGAYTFIPPGVTISNDVFIGPRVTFTNDKYPPSSKSKWAPTLVHRGAVIGAGVVVLPGVDIGVESLIGAGAVVTRNVDARATLCGNPAIPITKG